MHELTHPSSSINHHPQQDQSIPKGRKKGSMRADSEGIAHNYRFDLTNLVNEYGFDVIPGQIKELGSRVRLKRRFAEDMFLELGRPIKEDFIRALEDPNPQAGQQSARILGL